MTAAMSAVRHHSKGKEVDEGGDKEDDDDETKSGEAVHFFCAHPARGREVPPTSPLPQLPVATFSSSLRLINIRYEYTCLLFYVDSRELEYHCIALVKTANKRKIMSIWEV